MQTDHPIVTGPGGPQLPGVRTRRGFLTDCGRGTILAGLAVLGGWLALRKGDPEFVERCLKQRVCQGCGLFHGCTLPQADATRRRAS